MALYDDRRFLLSHINHSFITGDDTGVCEVVMLDEDVYENQHKQCLKLDGLDDCDPGERLDPECKLTLTIVGLQDSSHQAYDLDYESELFESEQGQSYDIAADLDYISHRRRSNTAQRLDRLKKEKINQSRTKTIVWRCNSPTDGSQSEDRLSIDSPTLTGGSKDDLTAKETGAIPKPSRSPPEKSGLTLLLERFPALPKNPFDDYAQFDGGMSEAVPTLKIMIFIALSQSQAKSTKPLEIVIVSTAKVQDLIGLICWQFTNEGREPRLHADISRYCLRIAEDNGEVDPDFTSLNPREPLSKFNFPSLALTERTEERVRTYTGQNSNETTYTRRPPSIAQSVITRSTKVSNTSKFAVLTRMIFKDAKLDTNR